MCTSSMFDHITLLLRMLNLLHWLKAPEWMSYKVAVLLYQCHHSLNYDDQQTLKTFHLVNVLSRPTHSAVYRRQQSVSCCVRSSVEQSSIASHRCSISLHLSLSSKISSLLFSLIPVFGFFLLSFTCLLPAQ